jgi:hypothetical protein
MKCPKCQADNKDTAKNCRKCGVELAVIPIWKPDWKWHLKVLGIVYVFLIFLYFGLNILLKPYMRQIPKDITPWLDNLPQDDAKTQKAANS